MAFDLSQYETVDDRLHRWWKEYADGRVETELIEASNSRFIVLCKLPVALDNLSSDGLNSSSVTPNAKEVAVM